MYTQFLPAEFLHGVLDSAYRDQFNTIKNLADEFDLSEVAKGRQKGRNWEQIVDQIITWMPTSEVDEKDEKGAWQTLWEKGAWRNLDGDAPLLINALCQKLTMIRDWVKKFHDKDVSRITASLEAFKKWFLEVLGVEFGVNDEYDKDRKLIGPEKFREKKEAARIAKEESRKKKAAATNARLVENYAARTAQAAQSRKKKEEEATPYYIKYIEKWRKEYLQLNIQSIDGNVLNMEENRQIEFLSELFTPQTLYNLSMNKCEEIDREFARLKKSKNIQ